MDSGFRVENVYDLGGSTSYVIEYRSNNNVLYYGFKANSKLDIINYIGRLHNSHAYSAKERGKDRIYIMNAPHIIIYFVEG